MNSYREVADLLGQGAVGLLPSDTIYGLSCAALNESAVERIYRLKGRDYDKPMIILLSDIEQARRVGVDLAELEPVRHFWPAPLTVIVKASKQAPAFLHRGSHQLAVRVPDDERLRKLIRQTGPLVSTSANPQGQEPAETLEQAKYYFGDRLDFYIDAGEIKTSPSTLVRIENSKLNVVRQGAYQLPAKKLRQNT